MKNWIISLILFGTGPSYAADGGNMPVQPTKPTPRIVTSGPDTYVDFQDGRVAGFYQIIGPAVSTRIDLNQIENTCDYQEALTHCKLQFEVAPIAVSVRWVQHPDAKKVGQIVKYNSNPKGNPDQWQALDEDNNLFFWYNSLKDPTYKSRLKPDRLVCDSFAWARNIQTSNLQIKIDSWASEVMTKTRETEVNENQTVSNIYDVTLNKLDNQTYEFTSFGKSKELSFLPPYFSTQVATLTFIDQKKQSCLVSFEASLNQVLKDVGDPEFRKKDPSTLRSVRNSKILSNGSLIDYMKSIFYAGSFAEFE